MKFTESLLHCYAAPLSESEDLKCKRAIESVRDALKNLGYTDDDNPIKLLEDDTYSYSISMYQPNYSNGKIHVFIQGSYANNTCVNGESDVDIAIVKEDVYEKAFNSDLSLVTCYYKNDAKTFKDDIEFALRRKFPMQVHRNNRSIKVDGNTYRKDADAVPCYSMRYFHKCDQNDFSEYKDGVVIYGDDGSVIRNFPKQHISNGKYKNLTTKYYYKKMVRIMKKMRYLMKECHYAYADKVSSFGLESLVWNIPNNIFTKYTAYRFAFKEVVDYLYNHKMHFSTYKEANGIKKLFPNQEKLDDYKKFIDSLKIFYEYDIME